MRVFSYVLTHDNGFSPNPFHGVLTLACCKPKIRLVAKAGDVVVGLNRKAKGNRLAYAMVVGESLTFAEYWADPRFRAKRPVWPGPMEGRAGDNCYQPLPGGRWRQHRCWHSAKDGGEDAKQMAKDLSGENVLVARRSWYFGGSAVALPRRLAFLVAGRGHLRIDDPGQVRTVLAFLDRLPGGVQGVPDGWPRRVAAVGVAPGQQCGAPRPSC